VPDPIFYFMTPWRPSMRDRVDVMTDGQRTVFIPLKYLYPECLVLIEKEPKLYPLQCLRTSCHRDKNCMNVLAGRVKYFFDRVTPEAGLIIAYYKWRDQPNLLRAGVFDADFREPRQIVCRMSAFRRFQREGDNYRWDPPSEFYLLNTPQEIIPTKGLIHE